MKALNHDVAWGDCETGMLLFRLYRLHALGSSNTATVLRGGLAIIPQLFAKNNSRMYAYLNCHRIGLDNVPASRKHHITMQPVPMCYLISIL